MPTFTCYCGHIISLVSVPSPHEASLISDKDFDELCRRRVKKIDEFLAACHAGNRNRWITEFIGHDLFDLSDGEIIDDIIIQEDVFSVRITTCPECGRLYRQRKCEVNEWDAFMPDPLSKG